MADHRLHMAFYQLSILNDDDQVTVNAQVIASHRHELLISRLAAWRPELKALKREQPQPMLIPIVGLRIAVCR